MSRLETLVEKKIREAMEKGEFDNLPGKGNLVVREFREKALELNARIKIYNLKTPAVVFQRSQIDADAEILRACRE